LAAHAGGWLLQLKNMFLSLNPRQSKHYESNQGGAGMNFIKRKYESGDILLVSILILAALAFMMSRFRVTDTTPHLFDLIHGRGTGAYQPRWLTWFTLGKGAVSLVGENEKAVKQIFCLFDMIWFILSVYLFYSICEILFSKKMFSIFSSVWFAIGLFFQYATHTNLSIYQPYDMPAVLIAVLSLFIVFSRPGLSWALIPIVGIGAFNRETTLLLIPLMFFVFQKPQSKIISISLGVIIWFAAYIISRKFIAPIESSGWAEFHEEDQHLRPIASIHRITTDFSAFISFTMLCAYSYVPIILYFKKLRKSVFTIFWPSIVLGFGIFFFVGNLEEIRMYSEILPMMILQGSAIVFSIFGGYDPGSIPKNLIPFRSFGRNSRDSESTQKIVTNEAL
jgi:hypothetical protein